MKKSSNFLFAIGCSVLLTWSTTSKSETLPNLLAESIVAPGILDSLTISGVILDINGNPVKEALVSFEGVTMDPIITTEDGKYSAKLPSGNVWMVVSPIGDFQKKRVFVNGNRSLNVYLTPKDIVSGGEEIFTGLRTKSKRDINASFSSFDVENLQQRNVLSVDQAIKGKAAGVLVTNNSGMPGSGTYTTIRGVRSLFANNQPLYIVDGIPYENANIFKSVIEGNVFSPISNVEPTDISNVTVFKDAAACSLYGLKGSNGVIVIETLKPTELKTTIDVNVKTGFYSSTNQLPVLNSEQYRSLANDVLSSSLYREEIYRDKYPGLFDDVSSPDYFRYHNSAGVLNNTDWQSKIFRNSVFNDVSLVVKGGDEIAKYGLSVGFLSHGGTIKNTDYSRANIRFVGEFNIYDWLKMYSSSSLNYSNSNLMNTGWELGTSPILTSLTKTPLINPTLRNKDTGENLPAFLDNYDGFGVSNPVAAVNGFIGVFNAYRMITSNKFEAKLSDYVTASALFGLNFFNSRERVYMPNIGMVPYYNNEVRNVAKNQTSILKNYFGDASIKYERALSSIQKFSALAGYRFQINKMEQDFEIGKNLPESDQYTSVSRGDINIAEIGGDKGLWNWASFYGNAQYALLDRYLVNASVSIDGSSRVGATAQTGLNLFDQPFGVFPAIGLGWRVSNENFLKELDWLEEFKIRGSYGLSGNDDIGNYNSYVYYEPRVYRSTTGLILGSRPNTDLKFETSYQANIGADLSFFGDRFGLTIDYFNTKTKDMLVLEKQETYLGYDLRPTNGGEALNTGFELGLNARLIESSSFRWDVAFNVSKFKNELTAIKGGTLVNGVFVSKVGSELNSFYGYIADGVFSSTQEAQAAGLVNSRFVPYGAGDMKFRDLNGDKVIDEKDKTVIGSPNPEYFGGLTNTFKYKRWSLNAYVQFAVGQELFNQVRSLTEGMTGLNNQVTSTLNRWSYEGQVTPMPKASYGDPIGNTDFSTRWIEDGSYVRLKSLTLAYSMPEGLKIGNKEVLRSLQIYGTATNLFTFTKYLGYDPEFSYGANVFNQGIDYGQMPQVRSFMVGVKFGL